MTAPSIREALKPCPFCGSTRLESGGDDKFVGVRCLDCDATGPNHYITGKQWNTRATTAPPQDAVEGIARTVTSELEQMHKDGVQMCMREGETTWRTYHAGFDLSMFAQRISDAILASGLVTAADEAFIRAEWHTTGWDRARNSGRILLVWREFEGVREHVELGRYSDSKTAWVNTYGHPFHCEPDGWAPLLPFATETAIRADEREKCARLANDDAGFREGTSAAEAGHRIAAAIRAGGAK